MPKYFFDTYALIAIIKNNPNYIPYLDEIVVTSDLNLIELYYIVLKDFNEEKARIMYAKFKDCVINIKDEAIFDAMKLKLKNKDLSYADCIGYILALKNDLKFLTGDQAFKDMKNVEYIK